MSPPCSLQGALGDPLYFDFICFSQFAAASRALSEAKQVGWGGVGGWVGGMKDGLCGAGPDCAAAVDLSAVSHPDWPSLGNDAEAPIASASNFELYLPRILPACLPACLPAPLPAWRLAAGV